MANKYGKGMFEEYFHVNPEFSRMTEDFRPDTLRAKKQAAGIAAKTTVYTAIGFTRIVCRFRYNP